MVMVGHGMTRVNEAVGRKILQRVSIVPILAKLFTLLGATIK